MNNFADLRHLLLASASEIRGLRNAVRELEPKARAYDNLSAVIAMLPPVGWRGEGLDVVPDLMREAERLEKAANSSDWDQVALNAAVYNLMDAEGPDKFAQLDDDDIAILAAEFRPSRFPNMDPDEAHHIVKGAADELIRRAKANGVSWGKPDPAGKGPVVAEIKADTADVSARLEVLTAQVKGFAESCERIIGDALEAMMQTAMAGIAKKAAAVPAPEDRPDFVAYHGSDVADGDIVEVREKDGSTSVMKVGSPQFKTALRELGGDMPVRRATAEQAAPWIKRKPGSAL